MLIIISLNCDVVHRILIKGINHANLQHFFLISKQKSMFFCKKCEKYIKRKASRIIILKTLFCLFNTHSHCVFIHLTLKQGASKLQARKPSKNNNYSHCVFFLNNFEATWRYLVAILNRTQLRQTPTRSRFLRCFLGYLLHCGDQK